MSEIDDRERGLYRKYELYRVKEDDSGNVREHYQVTDPFFVLRYTTDPHAAVALKAYADSCEHDYPQLAAELREVLRGRPECECDEPACMFCDIHGETGNRDGEDDCRCNTVDGNCPEHGPR
ncbi:hypothetical protein [Mycolicibacterium llatzerense]|uniref:hypothetical protein n=1 Tax=Mycolicibacterium llatzerense TaxID=280871 RepID=UPI0021B5D76A|nr:hypothetical protein [Mycolicibacterium llatzerense]